MFECIQHKITFLNLEDKAIEPVIEKTNGGKEMS